MSAGNSTVQPRTEAVAPSFDSAAPPVRQSGEGLDQSGSSSPGATSGSAAPPDSGAAGRRVTAPPLPADSGAGKRVVFDTSDQRVWLVDDQGAAERTYLVSGSRNGDLLEPGSYAVYSRSFHAIALNHKETMNYMVRFAHGDHAAIGFHDIPASVADGSLVQSRRDLGTPLSAGCVRQWRGDAKALWRFARFGTIVVVTA